jgi:hypothetical protein
LEGSDVQTGLRANDVYKWRRRQRYPLWWQRF